MVVKKIEKERCERMVLVYVNKVTDTLLFARQEFCRYMTKITEGIRFEPTVSKDDRGVHLLVDPNLSIKAQSDNHEAKDCYNIEANGTDIAIVGNSDRAVLLGVYRYLTECGYLFLGPGPEHEQVPDKIDLKNHCFTLIEQAHYNNRGVSLEGADSLDDVLHFIDWLPKLGGNSFFIHLKNPYVFLKRWYEHDHNPKLGAEPFSLDIAECMTERIEYELSKRALLRSRLSHEWFGGKIDFSATQGWNDDEHSTPSSNTQLALLNSERALYSPNKEVEGLCLHDSKVCEAFIEGIVSYAVSRPDIDYLHIELLDVFDSKCECEKCRNVDLTDRYTEIFNRLDDRLTEEGMPTHLCFEERYGIFKVSVFQNLKTPNRFVRTMVPNRDSFEVTLGEARVLESKRGLRRIKSLIYDSPLKFTHFGDLGYISLSQTIAGDLKSLDTVGISGYISCQEMRVGLPNHFPNYVMAKMSWDPSLLFDDLIKEYFEGAYGSEWKKVYTYLEQLSKLSSPDYVSGKGTRIDNELASKFTEVSKVIIRFSPVKVSHFRLDNKVHRNYWQVLSYHDLFCEKWCKVLFYQALGQEEEVSKEALSLIRFIRDNEKDYRSYLDVYSFIEGITAYTGLKI